MSHAVPNPSTVEQYSTNVVPSRPPVLRETLRGQALSSACSRRVSRRSGGRLGTTLAECCSTVDGFGTAWLMCSP